MYNCATQTAGILFENIDMYQIPLEIDDKTDKILNDGQLSTRFRIEIETHYHLIPE